eukprot:jgi/Botrbrau1/14037/Bobra.0011s0003.1
MLFRPHRRRKGDHRNAVLGDCGPETAGDLKEDSGPQHLLIFDDFLTDAGSFRAHFETRFDNPLQTRSDRFVWDFWNVEGQYSLMRTPADQFFPPDMTEDLVDALISFGESNLGCRGISPMWLSYYIDGCRQELHTDSPHGPWAFVLSLTPGAPGQRAFTGGETMLLQPWLLDYWNAFDPSRGLEMKDLMTMVDPLYNRLTVFDPRLPHGVRPVSGTRDPKQARLVLHGWFVEPTPFFTGPLGEDSDEDLERAVEALNQGMEALFHDLEKLPVATGTLTARLRVSGATGHVDSLTWLTDTLVPIPHAGFVSRGSDMDGIENARAAILRAARRRLASSVFPPTTQGDSHVTVPIVFQ